MFLVLGWPLLASCRPLSLVLSSWSGGFPTPGSSRTWLPLASGSRRWFSQCPAPAELNFRSSWLLSQRWQPAAAPGTSSGSFAVLPERHFSDFSSPSPAASGPQPVGEKRVQGREVFLGCSDGCHARTITAMVKPVPK